MLLGRKYSCCKRRHVKQANGDANKLLRTYGNPNKAVKKSVCKGFNMVEVLVSLVVLGVGMLGVTSLFVVSIQANSSAISRTQAVNLAADMADRIRANRTAGRLYSTGYGGAIATNNRCNDIPTAPAQNCTVGQMAGHDLFLWQDLVSNTLPGFPSGNIDVDTTTTPATYMITLSWTVPNSGTQSYTLILQI
jgi:type IV pilus assembly protein PilV